MNVLMITPRVDETHSILGFIPTWVRKLAERVDALYVITSYCNQKTQLPENVTVYRLAKVTDKFPRFTKAIAEILYLYKILIRLFLRKKVDVIFCHMYPNFTLQVTPCAKLFRKPIVTWFTHGYVSRRLRIAHFFANKMVTASKESLRIKSNRIIITGHGIDIDKFKPLVRRKKAGDKKIILSVSRISPRKNVELLIQAANILVNKHGMKDLKFVIVGGVPMASQEKYFGRLKKIVQELKLTQNVKFVGSVPYTDIHHYYQDCNIFISTSQTGSLDKTVLEAIATEKPTIVSNDSFDDIYGDYSHIFKFRENDPIDLANKIVSILQLGENKLNMLCRDMKGLIVKEHSVGHLMDSLIMLFKDIKYQKNKGGAI